MRKGGIGGANTLTGLAFEGLMDLSTFISMLNGYTLLESPNKKGKSTYQDIFYKENLVGQVFQKYGLYNFLESESVDWSTVWSKKILPDDALFVILNNKVFIIEKKYQETEGSVDEKLQTCDFKKKQYKKLFALLNIDVEYVFILSKWYTAPKYKDSLDYVISVGCHYYFDYIPFNIFGLPLPEEI